MPSEFHAGLNRELEAGLRKMLERQHPRGHTEIRGTGPDENAAAIAEFLEPGDRFGTKVIVDEYHAAAGSA